MVKTLERGKKNSGGGGDFLKETKKPIFSRCWKMSRCRPGNSWRINNNREAEAAAAGEMEEDAKYETWKNCLDLIAVNGLKV